MVGKDPHPTVVWPAGYLTSWRSPVSRRTRWGPASWRGRWTVPRCSTRRAPVSPSMRRPRRRCSRSRWTAHR
ncbi:hypothetical protein [Ornithinimicrobium kibberense]|uniref:hypothetical protein n=1 Tax=Ornithinimicrobium kibberense TaxID=282060 RepID=UPI003621EE48